jgi:hypothetical protein
MVSPAATLAGAFPTALDFTRIVEAAGTLEQAVTNHLVRGQSGWVPRAVVGTAWQLHAVTDLSVAGGREADLVYLVMWRPRASRWACSSSSTPSAVPMRGRLLRSAVGEGTRAAGAEPRQS